MFQREQQFLLLNHTILRPARDWEILTCIKLTQHYKMH
jgi:hypothetical protein